MKKKFDAVEFQRRVREKLSKEFNSNPEAFMRGLKETHRAWKKKSKAAAKKRRSA
jgi:hypothetical protein